MKKSLTQKQLKFIYEFVKNGGIAVRAALVAYDTENYKSASKLADSNLKNDYIRKTIEKALNKREITADKIAVVLADGLNAKILEYSPETMKYNVSKLPDHNARHKYLELVADILGLR